MRNIRWYIGRLKAMSLQELINRVRHILVDLKASRMMGFDIPKITLKNYKALLSPENLSSVQPWNRMRLFDKYISIEGEINWHLDPHSGNEFPKIFAKKIDTRGFNNMSAKHVWEINRMLYLPLISIYYKNTGDEKYLKRFIEIITSWKQENPYMVGLNWYSNIELSIRLINWAISWEILDAPSLMKKSQEFKSFVEEVWLPIVYLHCKRIRNTFSKYSSANNHLIAELAGLFIASSVWDFKESRKWNSISKKGLEEELLKQFSENGVNREEASGYIQFITDFFIICAAYAKKSKNDFSEEYYKRISSIADYVYELIDLKGNIVRYGDEDDGHILFFYQNEFEKNFKSILSTAALLFSSSKFKAKSLGFDLKNSILFGEDLEVVFDAIEDKESKEISKGYIDEGHFFLRKKEGEKEILLHFDAAPLGYLSIAAHGHADALSFTLNVDGIPVFVDNGTYTYHTDHELRKYLKGTLAHNTIRVDNKDQAKFEGPSLWSNHFDCNVLKWETNEKLDEISATHNGYRKDNVSHSRTILFDKNKDKFIIKDELLIEDGKEHLFEICFHLLPDHNPQPLDSNRILIMSSSRREVIIKLDNQMNYKTMRGDKDSLLGFYSSSFRQLQTSTAIYGRIKSNHSLNILTEIFIKES